nr:MAG TPA: hypothetical protein [Caudoviricetes sp.]
MKKKRNGFNEPDFTRCLLFLSLFIIVSLS